MNRLHPGAKWLFRLRAYYTLICLGVFLVMWSLSIFVLIADYMVVASFAIAFYILLVIVVAEIYSQMSYTRWLYEIAHDSVKIEHGIIWKKYTSIPFERVQNVDIKRGIIARIFGFSTVEIETAGQSGMGGSYGFRFGRRGYR